MRIASKWVFTGALSLGLAGCGGFAVEPVTPLRAAGSALETAPVSQVVVEVAPAIDGDKAKILDKYAIPNLVATRLVESFASIHAFDPNPGGLTVQVRIAQFRLGRYDAARLHTETVVLDATGAVLRTFETVSVSNAMSSRTDRLERITQDTVAQVANGV